MFRSSGCPLRASAAVATLLFLSLLALASSSALHRALHADAQDAHHHCVITMLAQGQMDAPVADISTALPHACVQGAPPVTIVVPSIVLELLPPGRAPPSAS